MGRTYTHSQFKKEPLPIIWINCPFISYKGWRKEEVEDEGVLYGKKRGGRGEKKIAILYCTQKVNYENSSDLRFNRKK